MITKEIVVHQALHGYREGHRLIACSTNLSSKSLKTIQYMSDMSGPKMIIGFEEYITGYYIDSDSFFVIAKTWYASEMSRPGCVWTHSLLIRTSDLVHHFDVHRLSAEFRRPSAKYNWDVYSEPIKMVNGHMRGYLLSNSDEATMNTKALLYGLYSSRKVQPVVLPVQVPKEYEKIILLMWAQQSLASKRSFLFCTGSINLRFVEGQVLDLQLVPFNWKRHYSKNSLNIRVLSVGDSDYNESDTEWLDIALTDLRSNSFFLRDYCNEFGRHYETTRETFAMVFSLYGTLRSVCRKEQRLESLISQVADYLPTKDKGTRIKSELFCVQKENWQNAIFSGLMEIDKLDILVRTPKYKMLDHQSLDIYERGRRLYRNNKEQALYLLNKLSRRKQNSLGRELLSGIFSVITPQDAIDIGKRNPGTIGLLLRYMPMLVEETEFWSEVPVSTYEALRMLSPSIKNKPNHVRSIVTTLIKTGRQIINVDTIASLGKYSLFTLLEWLNTSPAELEKHRDALETMLSVVPKYSVEWLLKNGKVNPNMIVTIINTLNPISEPIKDSDLSKWIKLVEEREFDDYTKDKLSEFLLPIALTRRGKDADKLLKYSYRSVYETLYRDKLTVRTWRILDRILPDVPFYLQWDKCYRLRRALRERDVHIDDWRWWE